MDRDELNLNTVELLTECEEFIQHVERRMSQVHELAEAARLRAWSNATSSDETETLQDSPVSSNTPTFERFQPSQMEPSSSPAEIPRNDTELEQISKEPSHAEPNQPPTTSHKESRKIYFRRVNSPRNSGIIQRRNLIGERRGSSQGENSLAPESSPAGSSPTTEQKSVPDGPPETDSPTERTTSVATAAGTKRSNLTKTEEDEQRNQTAQATHARRSTLRRTRSAISSAELRVDHQNLQKAKEAQMQAMLTNRVLFSDDRSASPLSTTTSTTEPPSSPSAPPPPSSAALPYSPPAPPAASPSHAGPADERNDGEPKSSHWRRSMLTGPSRKSHLLGRTSSTSLGPRSLTADLSASPPTADTAAAAPVPAAPAGAPDTERAALRPKTEKTGRSKSDEKNIPVRKKRAAKRGRLQALVGNPKKLMYLMKFLRAVRAEELVLFWLAVESYKGLFAAPAGVRGLATGGRGGGVAGSGAVAGSGRSAAGAAATDDGEAERLRKHEADKIYATFLEPGGGARLELPGELVGRVQAALAAGQPVAADVFSECQRHVKTQLKRDYLPRFFRSELYVDLMGLLFEEDDGPDNIIMEEPDSTTGAGDGRPQIMAATLEKLVQRLTYDQRPDPVFLSTFLLTYRAVTTASDLLDMLVLRFHTPSPESVAGDPAAHDQWIKAKLVPIRLRVYNVLKTWLTDHWYDFAEAPPLLKRLRQFIAVDMVAAGMANPRAHLESIIAKQLENKDMVKKEFVAGKKFPTPILPAIGAGDDGGDTAGVSMLTVKPLEAARQLTLIDYAMLKAITPKECLNQRWTKENKKEQAPNIIKMIEWFNHMSGVVATQILTVPPEKKKRRVRVLRRFIKMADHCRRLNNFNGMMYLVAGLYNTAVFRLHKTWKALSAKIHDMWSELAALARSDENYAAIRKAMRKAGSPSIPYLGVLLSDLTFIEDGNENYLPDTQLVNVTKMRFLARVIHSLQQCHQMPYMLLPVESIQDFFRNAKVLDEQQLYELSQAVEFRQLV